MKTKTAAAVAAVVLAMGTIAVPVRAVTMRSVEPLVLVNEPDRNPIDMKVVDALANVLARILDKYGASNCADEDNLYIGQSGSITCDTFTPSLRADGTVWKIRQADFEAIDNCAFALFNIGHINYLVYIPKAIGAKNIGELLGKGAVVTAKELKRASAKASSLRGGEKIEKLLERCAPPKTCL